MERSEFRLKMDQFKQARASNPLLSYWEWKNSLPDNLANTPDWLYNNIGAWSGGLQPELGDDGYYHLGSRNPYTGEILKPKSHPTYDKAILNDAAAGYFPYEKNGITYTKTYSPTGDISGYANGTDSISNKKYIIDKTNYNDLTDSPYEDVKIEDRFKPRFELRKEKVNYYSKPFVKFFKNTGNVLRILGPVSTFIENVFPSEDAETIDDLRMKMKESENRINKINVYANGTDGIQSNTSEIPVTYSNGKWSYGYNPGAGFLKPVISILDAADLTPIGNAMMANDIYLSANKGDYITAGLIGAAALMPNAVSKPLKKIVREIPSFNPRYFTDKLNKLLLNKEVKPNGLNRKIYTDAINQRNRVIEDLYTDLDYWDRAKSINKQYGDDYTEVYKGVLDTYENKYIGLPEPKAKLFYSDAKAEMAAKKDAIERFRMNKIPAGYTDFEYNISPYLDRIDRPTALHELGHYVDFNLSKNSNADYGNNMFQALKKDLSTSKNPLYPDQTDYFRQGTEQKSYMNTLRSYMLSIGLMDKPGLKVTTKTIKRAINSLPSEMNAVRAAYLLFDSPGKYTKWFNKIPLLGIPGAAMYLENKNESN